MNEQQTVSLADAKRVIAAGETQATQIGQPMNIAVVDAGGNLVAHVRMDGAWLGSVDIAINKAYTARAFDLPTADLAEQAQPGQQFYGIAASNDNRIMIFAAAKANSTTPSPKPPPRHSDRSPGGRPAA